MDFSPNDAFKKDYDALWKEDPMAANALLLLCELADKNGEVRFNGNEEDAKDALFRLMLARFNDPEEYAL